MAVLYIYIYIYWWQLFGVYLNYNIDLYLHFHVGWISMVKKMILLYYLLTKYIESFHGFWFSDLAFNIERFIFAVAKNTLFNRLSKRWVSLKKFLQHRVDFFKFDIASKINKHLFWIFFINNYYSQARWNGNVKTEHRGICKGIAIKILKKNDLPTCIYVFNKIT